MKCETRTPLSNFNYLFFCEFAHFYKISIFKILMLLQIVGTSKNFQKRKNRLAMGSDSEDSYSSSIHGKLKNRDFSSNNNNKMQSFSPSTPPPTAVSHRISKRRKGIPHRAPMGGLLIEFQCLLLGTLVLSSYYPPNLYKIV